MKKFDKMNLKERREQFYKSVRYYFFDVLKMYDQELYLESSNESEHFRARMLEHEYTHGANQKTIIVSENWLEDCVDIDELERVAFHETIEALLGELAGMILHHSRCTVELPTPNLNAAIHRVIRKLEHTNLVRKEK